MFSFLRQQFSLSTTRQVYRLAVQGPVRGIARGRRGPKRHSKKAPVSKPIPSFAELGLSSELQEAVKDMGITTPTEVQQYSIPEALKGRDVLCAGQTGTGKTLAYLLPVIQQLRQEELSGKAIRKPNRPRAIVLAPSRELSLQILGVAKQISHHTKFSSAVVTGSIRKKHQKSDLSRPLDLLIATPGRLATFMESNDVFMSNVKYIVIDEADTMYTSSAGFRPSLDAVLNPAQKGADLRGTNIQYLLAAATLKPPVDKTLARKFKDVKIVTQKKFHQRPASVREFFVPVESTPDAKHIALREAMRNREKGKCIVFCNSAKSTRSTEHMLRENGYNTASLHGEMPPVVRKDQYARFKKGSSDVLVCTDVAARGLDIANVEHVMIFDFPKSAVDYMHRAGRTGRAGKFGTVTSLVSKYDTQLARSIQNDKYKPLKEVQGEKRVDAAVTIKRSKDNSTFRSRRERGPSTTPTKPKKSFQKKRKPVRS